MSQTVGAEVIAALLAAEGVRTVYGIVDQSRGHIRVETREGAAKS